MDNHEDFLDALTAYSRNPTREIPPILEQYLNGVAKNGETLFQWPLLKPLIVGKMEQVIGDLRLGLGSENISPRPNVENVEFEVMHTRIMDAVQKFNGAPFTIQRLCELLIDPRRHYKRSDKFLRGLEKNVLVVSTVDPFGRKVVSESGGKHLVNGMDTNGSPFFPRDSNMTSNLPPVPGWVTSTVAMATRSSNASTPDSTEEKQSQAQSESTLTNTTVSAGLVSSVYADQGEQPLAVHAEEVVEETVVTMDTAEVGGTVATDGGEALAQELDDEEEMVGEDTNASSSSSSSSSSSEELSTSSETAGPCSQATAVSETQARPWASIANEGENNRVSDSPNADSYSSSTTDSLSPTTEGVTCSTAEDNASESSSPATQVSHNSLAFEHVTSPEVHTTECHQHHIPDRTRTVHSQSQTATSEKSSTSIPSVPEHICSSAEVVASSTAGHMTSLETEPCDTTSLETEACDSVAGLERLVHSVEPSSMSVPFSALSASTSQSLHPAESLSSSPSTDRLDDSEGPKVKRCRMSKDITSETIDAESKASGLDVSISAASSEALDSTVSSAKSESSATTLSQPSVQDSSVPESVCIPPDCVEMVASNVEEASQQAGVCSHSSERETSSPPSQLASSNDSQGFDVCGDTQQKTTTEDKPTVSGSRESTEVSESGLGPEPMEQE